MVIIYNIFICCFDYMIIIYAELGGYGKVEKVRNFRFYEDYDVMLFLRQPLRNLRQPCVNLLSTLRQHIRNFCISSLIKNTIILYFMDDILCKLN